jgi:sulfur relay (sulfurtransferase) DsrF/TusC family protein
MKLMNIVSSGYRATLEEQDDTVVWISHCLRNAGAEVDLLLSGAAVNYPVSGQSVAPAEIGGRSQKHAPDVHAQVRDLLGNGTTVYVVREDLDERGIDHRSLLQEVRLVGREELPALLSDYEQIWHW